MRTKAEISEIRKKWMKNNSKYMKKYRKEYSKKNKEKIYVSLLLNKLKNKYGITIQNYFILLDKQDLKCAICKCDLYPMNKGTCIDHSHSNNRVRGLLCPRCNLLIGIAKEDIDVLSNSIIYIQNSKMFI